MNTPSHSILNLAILGHAERKVLTWPILIGSWLPDVALFIFYGWARLSGLPEAVIWNEAYYRPFWQDIFAIGNSIPLVLLVWGLAAWQRWPRMAALCLSMLLHHAEDLPFHNEDAHRHFWPLTDFRFISPISYWDPEHFGAYVALFEMVVVFGASFILVRRVRSRLGQGLIILVNVIYVIGYIGFYLRRLF